MFETTTGYERLHETSNDNNALENLKGRDHSADLGGDGRIILSRILGK
jgi:hypothetical protein